MSRLTVIAISDAFGKFWSDLAKDLDVALDVLGPADAGPARPETAVVSVMHSNNEVGTANNEVGISSDEVGNVER